MGEELGMPVNLTSWDHMLAMDPDSVDDMESEMVVELLEREAVDVVAKALVDEGRFNSDLGDVFDGVGDRDQQVGVNREAGDHSADGQINNIQIRDKDGGLRTASSGSLLDRRVVAHDMAKDVMEPEHKEVIVQLRNMLFDRVAERFVENEVLVADGVVGGGDEDIVGKRLAMLKQMSGEVGDVGVGATTRTALADAVKRKLSEMAGKYLTDELEPGQQDMVRKYLALVALSKCGDVGMLLEGGVLDYWMEDGELPGEAKRFVGEYAGVVRAFLEEVGGAKDGRLREFQQQGILVLDEEAAVLGGRGDADRMALAVQHVGAGPSVVGLAVDGNKLGKAHSLACLAFNSSPGFSVFDFEPVVFDDRRLAMARRSSRGWGAFMADVFPRDGGNDDDGGM